MLITVPYISGFQSFYAPPLNLISHFTSPAEKAQTGVRDKGMTCSGHQEARFELATFFTKQMLWIYVCSNHSTCLYDNLYSVLL